MLAGFAAGCVRAADEPPGTADDPPAAVAPASPLVAASTTMVTAWEVPLNPLSDPTLDDSPVSEQIRWGYRIFTDTPNEAPRVTGGKVTCSNCHLNVGQRELALPLVGIAGAFPEHNNRAGRLFNLVDRVVDCFLRSENATGLVAGTADADRLPTQTSPEVLAVTAFLSWLGKGYPVGESPPWRGRNAIPATARIPVDQIDPARGEAIFMEWCTNCHGRDGQGVQIGDKKAGPLWGPDSWNDGAGAARVYTLAGIIRYMMPYLDPGSLTDEDAQHVAAFITSKPRPSYPFKARDYLSAPLPADAVYYPRREPAERH